MLDIQHLEHLAPLADLALSLIHSKGRWTEVAWHFIVFVFAKTFQHFSHDMMSVELASQVELAIYIGVLGGQLD